MRFVTTRGQAPPVSFKTALFDGLAPDGGLYVPETIEPWTASDLARLPNRTLTEAAMRALRPFTRGEVDATVFEAVIAASLDFPIPLVEVERHVYALELFHGPTLAFKDVGARVMARLMASLHMDDEPLTVLAATSGDTGSAVAHAFHGVPYTRVVVVYPDGRISPTQEAQLTMFNHEAHGNVRAYAVSGSFDDCHRLTRQAFGDRELRQRTPLTSANSVNVGRLLPQMVYYFHAVAELQRMGRASSAPTPGRSEGVGPTHGRSEGFAPTHGRSEGVGPTHGRSEGVGPTHGRLERVGAELAPPGVVFSTPSGNFGNLTAGLMAKRAGLPIGRFVAATNVNDVVPTFLATGLFTPRASVQTLANAMDVGNPSNFERMRWLYDGDIDAMRRDITGSRHTDDDVRETIRRVYETRGYLLDPHSAIGYMGLVGRNGRNGRDGRDGIFLATAHPAKFAEIVEPIIGRPIEKPAPLAEALARPRHILKLDPTLDALRGALGA